MTTATESHDAQLAAIKARHQAVRDRINAPGLAIGDQVSLDGAAIHQAGLSPVWADATGRLWRDVGNGTMAMTFDPYAALRASLAEQDDTQAAQGFKAHEEESPVFSAEEIAKMERLPGSPQPINRINTWRG